MHELSLCEDLLDQALTIAQQHQAKYIEALTLIIGPLAGVEPLLLENAFAILKIGTLAETATLIIQSSPVIIVCLVCNQESTVSANHLVCHHCHSNDTQLLNGAELILANLTLFTTS